MTLLTPLGLLGLIGIGVLILIYVLRPNYQQKRVSSTYVWKLSLKYKKKRIPISKLRNILIIICQVLALIACAFMLTQPQKNLNRIVDDEESILVIDSSASMRTETDGVTRFDRAVELVRNSADKLLKNGGAVSVIIADGNPYFLCEKVTAETRAILDEKMDEIEQDEDFCSYGQSDVSAAMRLCRQETAVNPRVSVSLYTDTSYYYVPEAVQVVDVKGEGEWNAAILNAYAEIEDNFFNFYVDVACYGLDTAINLSFYVYGANPTEEANEGRPIEWKTTVECTRDTVRTVVFRYKDDETEQRPLDGDEDSYLYIDIAREDRVYAFSNAHLVLQENDSFMEDNSFDIYGGQKEVFRIQYVSNSPNTFFDAIMFTIHDYYGDRWDVQYTEVRPKDKYETSGFDLYIFEYIVPEELPTDGIVFLMDSNVEQMASVSGSFGFRVSTRRLLNHDIPLPLTEEETHPLMTGIVADKIEVTEYNRIASYDSSFHVLMSIDNDPALLVRDELSSDSLPAKMIVVPFSVHYSNFAITDYFPQLFENILENFVPATVERNAFEVYEPIRVGAKSTEATVRGSSGSDYEDTLKTLPATFSLTIPGTYHISMNTAFGKAVDESIYVKIPAAESNTARLEDTFDSPYEGEDTTVYFEDLMFYLALALFALLFVEWILNVRERI